MPKGYKTKTGERGIGLSGGQRQRIAIARAFLLDPRILILDDSMSAVDAETEKLLQTAVREVMRGRTSIIIAHRMSTVETAEQIVVLKDGELVAGRHALAVAAQRRLLPARTGTATHAQRSKPRRSAGSEASVGRELNPVEISEEIAEVPNCHFEPSDKSLSVLNSARCQTRFTDFGI